MGVVGSSYDTHRAQHRDSERREYEPIAVHNRLIFIVVFEPISRYNWLMKTYNWQQPDWPNFQYDLAAVQDVLFSIAEKTGLINGKLSHLAEASQMEAMINLMVDEAIKTSEIEGEYISRPDVRSSIKNQLGLNQDIVRVHDKRAHGIAELMLDVRHTFNQPLTEDTLFDWHLMLLSASPNQNLRVGYWRTHGEPMQIVSGRHGRRLVHYEAPPSSRVPEEMNHFIHWFNTTAPSEHKVIPFPSVRAAIAHLYFESIHPFEDGNGRIGRAIAEKALSQGVGYPVILSLSQAIEADKNAYYSALHRASKSNEITPWVSYFVNVVFAAQQNVEQHINFILQKSDYFDRFERCLNERQLKVIRRMMQAGIAGFEGGMSAKKYMTMTGTSKATATRDLQALFAMGALRQLGEGRSVRYEVTINANSP